MDEEKFYSKILAVSTSILFIIIAIITIIFIGIAKVEAREIGRIFYGGVQQGSTFTFNDADDIAQWTNTNANTIRYDNNDLIMTSGNTYTFSTRFTILLQDSIDTVTTIRAIPGYFRDNKIYDFKDTTCNIDYKTKILNITDSKKTAEHYISVSCPDISFSTGNNYIILRFAISNNGQYYNIIEMSRTGLIYKDNTNLTESDKIIISQNQNTEDIINNQNQNTQDIINNQNQNTDKITDAIQGDGLENTTPINPNNKNELEDIENDLLDENITTSLNNIDISIDTNTNEFIWNLITRIINTNSLIFGLVITMLSLGVIKLVLNR